MKTGITLLFGLAALTILLPAPALIAQESAARILVELDDAVPVKSPSRGIRTPINPQVNWDEVVDRIGEILARADGTSAEPMCLYYMGNALFQAERPEEALLMFQDLKERHPKHPLVTAPADDDGHSLVHKALEDCAKELAFRKAHKIPVLPIPELDPDCRAVLHMSEGDVEITFYKNVAPKHRENFLKLAREGFYDRICVHRITPNQDVYLGCPNTRERAFTNWGRGGPGYNLPNEFSRVFHERGIVSAVPAPRAGRSHGSQFVILLKSLPAYDFVQTPFARVTKGLDVVEKISILKRNQNSAPLDRVYLNGITVHCKEAGKPATEKK